MISAHRMLIRLKMREAFAHIAQPGHDSLVIRNRETGSKLVICKTCGLGWEKPGRQRPDR
jgi:hypothetical protein